MLRSVSMTSRERLLTALGGGTPDRVPVAPFGWGALDPDGPAVRNLLARCDPLVPVGCGPSPFASADLPATIGQAADETVVTLHTPWGDWVKRVRRTRQTSATVEFPLKTYEDVKAFLELPYVPPEPEAETYHRWCERVGEEGLVLAGIGNAVCCAAEWLAPEDFCTLWADDPGLMVEMTAQAAERLNAAVEQLCRAGVGAFRIVGGEYVTVQLGPRAFEALVAPFDTELVEIMHRHGALAYYHNHGPIMPWLGAIADLGVDALDPLEASPWGDADLREAKRCLQGRVCLVGNLDDMEVLEKSDEDTIRSLARRRLDEAGPDGFILGGTASGTYGERAARHFIAMVEVAQQWAQSRK